MIGQELEKWMDLKSRGTHNTYLVLIPDISENVYLRERISHKCNNGGGDPYVIEIYQGILSGNIYRNVFSCCSPCKMLVGGSKHQRRKTVNNFELFNFMATGRKFQLP